MTRRIVRQSCLKTSLMRVLHDEAGGLGVGELRRFRDLQRMMRPATISTDAEQERQTPGEFAVEMARQQEHEVGEQHAERHAGLRDRGVAAAFLPRGVLEGHQDGAAPLRSEGEALDDADEREQDRGEKCRPARRSAAGR